MDSLRFRWPAIAVAVLLSGALAGCALQPPVSPVHATRFVPQSAAPPPVDVYAYPEHGQTAAQQDRDHYECYEWAKQQTGFDPSGPNVPTSQRVRIVSGPPLGAGVAAGAITGAALGAIVSGRHDTGAGAVVGALLGSLVGASAEANANERAREINTHTLTRAQAHAYAQLDRRASDYRRALSACLAGRGYNVR